jgi:F0F1-type ATP synthase delta subunit
VAPSQAVDPAAKQELLLPVLVFGVVEVRRLKRELEALDEFMRQSTIREPGKQAALPRVSRLLDALAGDNNRNLLLEAERDAMHDFLTHIEETAPTIHVSFASDPSSAFVAKLVTWLRGNIHPTVLLQIGLQPTLAAGCVVRTPNKVFDLSLRQSLAAQRVKLIEALDALAGPIPQPAVQPAAAQPQPQPEAAS